MQKILILINDAPYRTEKANNAFRMAMQIQKDCEYRCEKH
jgi:sulfur relay (sulfurtransferase) complex TusBCD TusD component (DsrE family)